MSATPSDGELDSGTATHGHAERERRAIEARNRTFFELVPDGILIADPQSHYLDANPGICSMLGYSRDELIGKHASDIVAPAEIGHIGPALDAIKSSSHYQREWTFKRKNGSTFDAEVIAATMPDGNLLAMVRDITGHKARERELQRLSRLYAVLSQVSQAIACTHSRDELLLEICRVLVEHGGFRMAWIGWHDPHSQRLLPVAAWGDERGYLRSIEVYADDRPEGRGPSGIAFRARQPYISNDLLNDPATLPWRAELERRGFRASAVFPIRVNDAVCATLSVYSDEAGVFLDKEIALLEEAAGDASFALDQLIREQDRREAEEQARGERLFSKTMIDSMPGIVYFYDEAGRFLRWNRNFERVSGYAAEEIARMHPLDFFSAEEKPALQQRIAEVFERGESSIEASFIGKDGTATPFLFTGRRVVFEGKPCLVGVGIDITERKRAEAALGEIVRKYRELVENANSIILRWTRDGRIAFLNEFGQRFFGYSEEEILGRHVVGTIVPEMESDGRDLKSLMDEICRNPAGFEQSVNENIRRNGERVWIAWTNKVALDRHGEVVEVMSIGSDVTARKQAEEELQAIQASLEQRVALRTRELAEAKHAAEAADRLKSAFLATMSHELRTPLNSIIGFTGIILQGLAGPLSAEQSKQLGMVRGSARHLLDLINDVLDISKIEAGQLDIRAESFDLRESLERVVAVVRPLAEKKGLDLELAIEPALGDMHSDRRRVEQILLNLLNNAIKFTDRGRVRLSAGFVQAPPAPAGDTPGPSVRLRVADTGMGIRPEDMDKLFQPFRQIDSGLTRQHEGTGLGLAICRRLSTLLGGDIVASSLSAKGSEFTVTLPLRWTPGA
jgi:PAS domain S-box-containing protein